MALRGLENLCTPDKRINLETFLIEIAVTMLHTQGKAIPLQAWTDPEASRRLRLTEFLDNRHIKAVRLSALSTGRLYSQEISLVLISVTGWVDPRAIVQPEGISKRKIPVTPPRTETATFRPVVQYLKQLSHRVPPTFISDICINMSEVNTVSLPWHFKWI